MASRLAWALCLFMVAACGDDDGSGVDAGAGLDAAAEDAGTGEDAGMGEEDAGGGDVVTAFCEAAIARDEMCGETPPDLAECVAEQACTLGGVFRPDAAAEVARCVGDLACDASDDPCYSATGLGLDPSEGAAAYTAACTTRRDECGAPFSDDFCFFDLAAEGVYEALGACLEEDCDTVRPCLLDVVTCAE